MGNVVVAIKSSGSSGASGVTRYIAESKRKPEKEGLDDKEPRPLFSEIKDGLTYVQANQLLQQPTDTHAQTEDLIHIVISPEKGQFEELGDTREERVEAFKEIIREAAEEIENEVNFVDLKWVAGIHLNTDLPHAHLAISREGWDRSTEQRSRINHVPRTLLPHNEKDAQGEKVFVRGKIAETVSQGIEKQRQIILQRNLSPQTNERQQQFNQISNHEEPGREQPPIDEHHQETIPESDHSQVNNEELARENNQISPALTGTDPTITTTQNVPTNHENEVILPPDLLEEPALTIEHDQPDTYTSFTNEPQETRFQMHEPSASAEELEKPPNVSEHLWRHRYILGRSMVARGEVDRLQSDLKSTQEHGDKRRFRVFDATHGHTRKISEFDIRRRADARAATAVRQAEILDPEQRHQARQAQYDLEIERHEKGIGDHQIIVAKTIHKLEGQLAAARKQHAELKPHVSRIQQHYNANHIPLPVPLLRPAEINKLQDQAIAARNPARVATIEKIRESLAVERGDPTRSDQEVARLDGQLLTARSEQAARQERAHQFESTRHQTRWEIDSEKYSLTDIDRRISVQQNRSRLFGTPLKINTLHLRPSSRREAAVQVKELKEIRGLVVEKIEARRQELSAAVKEAGRMTSVLSEILVKEQNRLIERNGVRQEKLLTRSEINQLIEHGNVLSDPAMLQHALGLESRFEERQAEGKKPTLTERAARAIGREILSEIALRQATAKHDSFKEHKQFTPVPLKDLKGDEQTARLFDFRHPRHPILWLAHRITEPKEQRYLRQQTTKAIDAEQVRLEEDLTKATQCHELTKDLSDSHRQQLLSSGQTISEAAFTPKQIIQLEIYATHQQDQTERSRIETLINRAELAEHSQIGQTHKDHDLSRADHSHYTDQQSNHNPDGPRDEPTINGSYQPETEQRSPALLTNPNNQSRNPQLNSKEASKENPDLDLLH